jgi:hypothetical protein
MCFVLGHALRGGRAQGHGGPGPGGEPDNRFEHAIYPKATWSGLPLTSTETPDRLAALITLGHPWSCVTSAISVRRTLMPYLIVPEDVFLHSPDLYLGATLPFVTGVALLEPPVTAYVYHGENVGLFRSSTRNREMHQRQMAYLRSILEQRFGCCVATYFGHGVFGSAQDHRSWGGKRVGRYVHEARAIAGADAGRVLKGRSMLKLTASFLLPTTTYQRLRQLKADRRG